MWKCLARLRVFCIRALRTRGRLITSQEGGFQQGQSGWAGQGIAVVLSIGRVRRGESGKQYYLQFQAEDYYLRTGGGEPPGQWEGRLGVSFGLHGLVGEEAFCKLFEGQSPTGEPLRQRRPNGRPAFDLTFSVSKDVSIIYMLADPDTKRKIEAATYAAVKEAMKYVEDQACMTRLGKNGTEVVKGGGLAAALFLHAISPSSTRSFTSTPSHSISRRGQTGNIGRWTPRNSTNTSMPPGAVSHRACGQTGETRL